VTEQEWLACRDVDQMLAGVRRGASGRKGRLFACACCRALWPFLEDGCARRALELAEQAADGAAEAGECLAAAEQVRVVMRASVPRWTLYRAVCETAARGPEKDRTQEVARLVGLAAHRATGDYAVRRAQPHLLRDLFGNPFRPVQVDPAWLARHGGAVVKLAGAVYEERELPSGRLDKVRLPALADLLEEAGCADRHLLGHLRGPGPHIRGCFAVDALLGKA